MGVTEKQLKRYSARARRRRRLRRLTLLMLVLAAAFLLIDRNFRPLVFLPGGGEKRRDGDPRAERRAHRRRWRTVWNTTI